ncbi:hypothetical protein Efla_007317 [Eimeria flavescens]
MLREGIDELFGKRLLFHCPCYVPCTEPGAFSPFPSKCLPQTASSIALLKLAYEGAMTLTRSLGSLVLHCICVTVTVFAASSFFDFLTTKEAAGLMPRRPHYSTSDSLQHSLPWVLNYLVGLQQCKTLLVLKTNFSSFGCSLHAADEIVLSASVGRVRRS